jgi:hypothetical protein
LDAPDTDRLLAFFKALADESRLKLLGLVAQREHSVQELADLVGIKEPTVSHHLAMLKRLGLVRQRVDGNTRWYALEPDAVAAMARQVLSREQIAGLAGESAPETFEDRVMRAFVADDGALKEIPATRKKRRVILAWLVRQFDFDRRYPEREINEQLKRSHWDCATLRREFIGYRMMAREDGVYWRLPEADWALD